MSDATLKTPAELLEEELATLRAERDEAVRRYQQTHQAGMDFLAGKQETLPEGAGAMEILQQLLALQQRIVEKETELEKEAEKKTLAETAVENPALVTPQLDVPVSDVSPINASLEGVVTLPEEPVIEEPVITVHSTIGEQIEPEATAASAEPLPVKPMSLADFAKALRTTDEPLPSFLRKLLQDNVELVSPVIENNEHAVLFGLFKRTIAFALDVPEALTADYDYTPVKTAMADALDAYAAERAVAEQPSQTSHTHDDDHEREHDEDKPKTLMDRIKGLLERVQDLAEWLVERISGAVGWVRDRFFGGKKDKEADAPKAEADPETIAQPEAPQTVPSVEALNQASGQLIQTSTDLIVDRFHKENALHADNIGSTMVLEKAVGLLGGLYQISAGLGFEAATAHLENRVQELPLDTIREEGRAVADASVPNAGAEDQQRVEEASQRDAAVH